LAVLLVLEKAIALGGEDMREFYVESFVESLEAVLAKVKAGRGKSALQLFKEMKEE
jgi:hypothetical protein